ncbi:MAG TPA: alpha-ketoglutarate-dependent dioxygenase AlkB, partial [Acidimicrobiales bacterium]|nr:alpha-ketoglutarate-dependent dioxygenase AlkB [Acidimicrobiales bacterium]
DHLPGWLSGHDEVMDELVRVASWQSGERPMYDRIVAIPRLTAWWRTPFDDAPPIIPTMGDALAARYGVRFTSVGCNLYRDGHDSVAWHGDRIDRSVPLHTIAIVSVGEPRKLLLRPNGGGAPSLRFDLGRGDLFVMGGTCQRTWQHCVPKVAHAAPRMSITYRHAMRQDSNAYAAG